MVASANEVSFVPEPERPAWFDRELRSYDEALLVVWHGVEGNGSRPHYVVMRKIRSLEKKWMLVNGIHSLQEVKTGVEVLFDYTDEAGGHLPLDRRFFEMLAANDPARAHPNLKRLASYKRMCYDRNAAEKKARAEEDEVFSQVVVDEVLVQASKDLLQPARVRNDDIEYYKTRQEDEDDGEKQEDQTSESDTEKEETRGSGSDAAG